MIEEFELPTFEALLAGTLALMTGYAQAAQAELDPAGRLAASRRIAENLALLRERPEASALFKRLFERLSSCWLQMTHCTAASAPAEAALAARRRSLH